jgi:hypothetical protein
MGGYPEVTAKIVTFCKGSKKEVVLMYMGVASHGITLKGHIRLDQRASMVSCIGRLNYTDCLANSQ